jgi:hypothetical protein
MPAAIPLSPENNPTSRFYCSSEWHFSRMRSNAAALVYNFARRISRNSGKYSCSDRSVAEYLDLHKDTIRRARKELVEAGWFVLLEYGMFDTNVYTVLSHKDWAIEHKDVCTKKEEFPWTAEGDPLGQKLHAASGCRVKFKAMQIAEYRKFGFSENTIVEMFEQWRAGVGSGRKPKNVGFHFFKYLRSLTTDNGTSLQ